MAAEIEGGSNATPHVPEGTAIKSTGETGGTKFLREDGDGTSSWQAPPVSKLEFYVKWDDASNSTPAGKVSFSGATCELKHDLNTPYIVQSVLDIGNHFDNAGANTYGDVNFEADSHFTWLNDNETKLTFGSEPAANKEFKVTIIG